MITIDDDEEEDAGSSWRSVAATGRRRAATPMMKDIWTTMNITSVYVKVWRSVVSLYPAVFLPRYEQINRRGRRRGRVLWRPIGGQLTLIHYYRGYGRRFWVVISSNPGNGVVYLPQIFTRPRTGPTRRSLCSLFFCYHCGYTYASATETRSSLNRVICRETTCPIARDKFLFVSTVFLFDGIALNYFLAFQRRITRDIDESRFGELEGKETLPSRSSWVASVWIGHVRNLFWVN